MKNISLVYASQQGNSKAIAEEIEEKCNLENIYCNLSCISELNSDIRNVKHLVIVGATTGDGDPPDTAKKFWRNLHNLCKKNEKVLNNLHYTILGLGDTNYTNFCNFGKTIDKKLEQLGAQRFYKCGWADDGIGLELVVEPWIEGLFPILKSHLEKFMDCSNLSDEEIVKPDVTLSKPNEKLIVDQISSMNDLKMADNLIPETNLEKRKGLINNCLKNLDSLSLDEINEHPIKICCFPQDKKLTLPVTLPSYIKICYSSSVTPQKDSIELQNNCSFPNAESDIKFGKITNKRILTNDGSLKKTFELSLKFNDDLSPKLNDDIVYEPGDSFSIISENYKSEVDCLIALLGLERYADVKYELSIDSGTKKKNPSIPNHISKIGTIRELLTYSIDIRTVPKKTFIRSLCAWTTNSLEKRRFEEMVSKEGSAEYNEHIRSPACTLLDILILFQSCQPPISLLIEQCPRLIPRSYSIISSPLSEKNEIKFAFNLLEISKENKLAFSRAGICTGWLSGISPMNDSMGRLISELKLLTLKENHNQIKFFMRSNKNFRLPQDSSVPLIMVGPGTGIAPFIGFLEHQKLLNQQSPFEKRGFYWLFFGCRHENLDYLYKNELDIFLKDKILDRLSVSFSRSCSDESIKYVQDNIIRYGEQLVDLIYEQNAMIYVCGDATNMAPDVFNAFATVIQQHKSLSNIDARKYVADLQINKRYLQDVWA